MSAHLTLPDTKTDSRLGIAHFQAQRWDDAIVCLARAVASPAPHEICIANLASALYLAGEENDALSSLLKAHEKDPESDTLAKILFYVALGMGKVEIADRVVQHALKNELRQISQAALADYGGLIKFPNVPVNDWTPIAEAQLAVQTGNYESARILYRGLVARQPRIGFSGQGVIAWATGDFAQALDLFERAIDAPGSPNAQLHLNRAKALTALSRHEEALTALDRTIEIQPDFVAAKLEKGTTALRCGDWEHGWGDYEARRTFVPDTLFNCFDANAEWQGEALHGKTLILVGEQGQGDILQFIRFASDLAHDAAEILVYCVPSLVRLIRTVPGIAHVFTSGETIPPYDYWIPLLSVPRVIGLRLEHLRWNGPYLHPESVGVDRWHDELARYRNVRAGIVWSGNDYTGHKWGQVYGRRNLTLDDFARLFAIPDIDWFSLQKGETRAQLAASPAKDIVIDHSEAWHDFEDTAEFLMNLDLVITVDTSVAHLAGALGKPVWILSRTDGCWRWLDRREDSPWYPSARIFHQGVGESWASVIERVAGQLSSFVFPGSDHP